MFKKLAIVAVAVICGAFLLTHTKVGSYTRTAWNRTWEKAQNQVPMEFEIDRIRDEISHLKGDVHHQLKDIANEIVAVDNLKTDVSQARVNLDQQRDAVFALKQEVEAGHRNVSFKGREYTAEKAKDKLVREWESYKRAEEALKSKESLLEAKETALSAARDQLSTMRSKKEELEVAVAQLEAELKTLRASQARSTIQLDDSRLARIKASVADLRNRLRSEVIRQELEDQFSTGAEVGEGKVKTSDLLKEIDQHFGNKGGNVVQE